LLRDNFAGIEEGLVPYDYLSLQVQASDPTPAASFGYLYSKDISSKGELHYIDEDSNVISLTSGGQFRVPSQSSFSVYNGTTVTGQTGTVGTGLVPVTFDTEVFDQGSDFNTSTFTWTCPVAGRCWLYAQVTLKSLTSAATSCITELTTSNRVYQSTDSPWDQATSSGDLTVKVGGFVEMDANDTALIKVRVSGEASDVVGFYGSGIYTWFGGGIIH
jgi:hypothetical protein